MEPLIYTCRLFRRICYFVRIFKESTLYLLGTGLGRGLPFLLLPVLTLQLSVEDYGKLSLATTIAGLLAIIVGIACFSRNAGNATGGTGHFNVNDFDRYADTEFNRFDRCRANRRPA